MPSLQATTINDPYSTASERKQRRALLIVLVLSGFLIPQAARAGYFYQAAVSIPPASTADQTNITLTITGSDTRLCTLANGGQIRHTVTRVGQTVPADLILSSDGLGANLYKWGFDSYDATGSANCTVRIWFLMPVHSHTSATTVFVSIGNADVTTYQGGTQGQEFDSNTKSAWHLPDGASLSGLDFSQNSNNASAITATAAPGQVDGGASFDGSSNNISFGPGPDLTSDFSISLWVNSATWGNSGSSEKFLLSKRTTFGNMAWEVIYDFNSLGSNGVLFWFGHAGSSHVTFTGGSMATGSWQHMAITRAGNIFTLYLNGVAVSSVSNAGALPASTDAIRLGGIGDASGTDYNFAGTLDEIRISNTARSGAWFMTEIANQNNPPAMGSFTSVLKGRLLGINR